MNRQRQKLISLKNVLRDIFNSIDNSGKGFIGEKDLVMYIQNNDLFKSSYECDLLFLRLNKLRNGKIEFKEMMDEIEPIF